MSRSRWPLAAAVATTLVLWASGFVARLAALAQAIYFVLQKPYLARYRPLEATAWAVWLGTLCLLPAAPAALDDLRRASGSATLSAVYLGVFPGAIAYACWAAWRW